MRPKPIAECVLILVILVFVLSGVFNYFFISITTYQECSDINHYRSQINNSGEQTNSISRRSYLSRKLIFLKTHKTASSTLSGIIWRELCERASLHCFLPLKNNPGRTWDFESAKDLNYMQKSKGTSGSGPPFDVWVHHARMHESIFSVVKIDAQSDAIQFMSIVRHPAMRFRSAWSWYELSSWFYPSSITFSAFKTSYTLNIGVQQMSLEQFAMLRPTDCASHTTTHHSTSSIRNMSLLQYFWSWYVRYISAHYFKYRTGLDATSEELVGLRRQGPGFESGYRKLFKRVLSGKVLLLVADRFDESLLVMRRLMLAQPEPSTHAIPVTGTAGSSPKRNNAPNSSYHPHLFDMPLHQLLYLRQKKQSEVEPLSEATKLKLTHLQPYDTALYEAANTMLDRYIARLYDANMTAFQEELHWLQTELARLEAVCGKQQSAREETQHRVVQEERPRPSQHHLYTNEHANIQDKLPSSDATHGKYSLLCENLQRDNKDLVREAWNTIRVADI